MTDTPNEKKDINPWARNIPSFIVLYSVLAAIAGVLLTVVLTDNVDQLLKYILAASGREGQGCDE
jgi:hypothetical protein